MKTVEFAFEIIWPLQAAHSILLPFIFETKNTYVLPFENEMKIEIIGKEYEWREVYKSVFHIL